MIPPEYPLTRESARNTLELAHERRTAVTTETLLELFRAPLVEGMEPRHVDILKNLAQDAAFREDEVILREGEAYRRLFVILRGRVALEFGTSGGGLRVASLGSGEEFGWSALLGETAQFTVRAATFVHALAFPADGLEEAAREDPAFGCALYRRLLGVASRRLAAARRYSEGAAFHAVA
jgi:CRP-like cAMP-binding protein